MAKCKCPAYKLREIFNISLRSNELKASVFIKLLNTNDICHKALEEELKDAG